MDARASQPPPRGPGPESGAPKSHLHYLLLAGAAAALLVLLLLARVPPDPRGYGTHERLLMLPCLPMQALGIPCPGCGVTTSVAHVMHGELGRALVVQPFGVLLVALTALLAPAALLLAAAGRDLGALFQRIERPWWWLLAGALGAAWIYKLASMLA